MPASHGTERMNKEIMCAKGLAWPVEVCSDSVLLFLQPNPAGVAQDISCWGGG